MTHSHTSGAARFVGQRVERREDARLLTGHGTYVDDVVLPGTLHAAVLRGNAARGQILSIDVTGATELDGVVAVFTAADLNRLVQASWVDFIGPPAGPPNEAPRTPFRVLAEGDVKFVGDPVALVVATSRYVAEDACELFVFDVEPLEPVLDVDQARAAGSPLVHPELASNVAGRIPAPADPDLERIFAAAPHVFTETYEQHRHLCVPMETRGVLAHWDPYRQELVVWLSTQGAHGARGFIARACGIPENRVRVIMQDVGGGFGQKMFMLPEELGVVLASKILGRPVKWIEDRRENLMSGLHARDDRMAVSFAVDDDGTILAMRTEHVENVGSFPAAGSSSIGFVGMLSPGPYKIGRAGCSGTAVYTNTCGRCSYRGPWMIETLAREQMVDRVACELGIDPLTVRRRNVLQTTDLPYTTAAGLVYDSISPAESLEQAARMIDYDSFREAQDQARKEGRLLGIGLSLYIEPSGLAMGNLASEAATIRLGVNGQAHVAMSSGSHGQSVETTVAQVVADFLGLDIDSVTVTQGDTASAPYGAGTGGSRSAVLCSGAAREASLEIRRKMIDIAAHVLEAAPEDLEIEQGRISVVGTPTKAISVAEVAQMAYLRHDALPAGAGAGLEASARYTPSSAITWSNSCHACTCEIDPDTGAVTLLRYVVSEDCGVMINPTVVEGQIAGGVVQGIGGVLYEHMAYDDAGNPLSTTFVDYLLPTATEVPMIEYGHIETPARTNPGGHKGMGEGGAIGSPPAVANAVADALAHLGVRVNKQPLGPANIVALIEAAGRSRSGAP
jgi:carbon-monoxide dehydrogenase large subunit